MVYDVRGTIGWANGHTVEDTSRVYRHWALDNNRAAYPHR